jgi:hypothetical protein
MPTSWNTSNVTVDETVSGSVGIPVLVYFTTLAERRRTLADVYK